MDLQRFKILEYVALLCNSGILPLSAHVLPTLDATHLASLCASSLHRSGVPIERRYSAHAGYLRTERMTTDDGAPRLRLVRAQSTSPPFLLNFQMMIFGVTRRILLEACVVALGNQNFTDWARPWHPANIQHPTRRDEIM